MEVIGSLITANGQLVEHYRLSLPTGIAVQILSLGAAVTRIEVPDREGRLENVVLGHHTVAEYKTGEAYFGACVGRYAGRIAGGHLVVDDRQYSLSRNEGTNHLHGGAQGFSRRNWTARRASGGAEAVLELCLSSPHGDEGYPGGLEAGITYTLSANGHFRIDYRAVTDGPTVVNLTNHSYFNLEGETQGHALGHELEIAAQAFCEVDEALIPTGGRVLVAGTPFDFRTRTVVGSRITQSHPQLINGRGYDHLWILDRTGAAHAQSLIRACVLSAPGSGRVLEVWTTEAGLQFYSGNVLDGSIVGTSGLAYRQSAGLCLETQACPDAPNQPSFPAPVLRSGDVYRSSTEWRFGLG